MPRNDVPPPGHGKRSKRKAWRDNADQTIAIYGITTAETLETTPMEDMEAMSHVLPYWDDEVSQPQSQSPQQTYTEEEVQELIERAYEKGWQEGMEEGCRLGRDPPPPVPVVTVDSGTQTQDDDNDSPPLPPVTSTAPVLDPPPETKSRSPPLPPSTRFDWANDAATSLPILPSNPPPRDLSILRSSLPKPFSSLQRCGRRAQNYSPRPSHNYIPSSAPRQKFYRRRFQEPRHPPSWFRLNFNTFAPASSVLNWENDPRLLDLSQALKALGWIRPPAARALPW